jgi:uncharacterized membrane protein
VAGGVMDLFYLGDWPTLLVRMAHVIFGIGWIGTSLYFVWLDVNIKPAATPRPGLQGETWLVHSGGFYRIEKVMVTPAEMPATLHWFKWEAAFTGLSGFLLLALIYYANAETYLVDPAKADLSAGQATAIGIATLAGGWVFYEGLWRSPLAKAGWLPLALTFLMVFGVAVGLSHIFSGHAAYMHVGALMGIIMSASVWTVIVPAQRQLIAATRASQRGDPALAAAAKQRSMHNNYMTFPVIFIMLSGHSPSTFGNQYAWLVLLLAALVAGGVNHFINLAHKGQRSYWSLIAAVVIFVPLFMLTTRPPGSASVVSGGPPVEFAEVRAVIAQRCATCHSAHPSDEDIKMPPNGTMFDTPQQIKRQVQKINARAVLTQTMPLGNKTEMTDDERALLRDWIAQGAKTD